MSFRRVFNPKKADEGPIEIIHRMTIDDRDIILAMRANPQSGFRLFMKKYEEAVYWHIRRLVVSHADAQDAAQETFVRIFRSFDRFKGDGSFVAWIYRIATNEAFRMLDRRKKVERPFDGSDADMSAMAFDGYVDYSDLEAVKLQRAILSLPTRQRLVFNLRYYDELDYGRIAEITDSTVAAAKSNYHIAKDRIVSYMNSHE